MLVVTTIIGCNDDKSAFGQSDNQTITEPDSAEDQSRDACSGTVTDLPPSLVVGERERSFLLRIPDNYDGNSEFPLIFALHGLGGSGGLANAYFGLNETAGNEAIIVYPDALRRIEDNGETGWDLNPVGSDFEFFDALYELLTTDLCVDTTRIYVTGHSYGGYMSNQLGCYRGNQFAAIAPVAGGGPWSACQTAVSAMIIHGTNDDVVELSQGVDSLEKWLDINGCGSSFTTIENSVCIIYDQCNAPVLWCEHGGEHEWPYFAPQTIWSFFAEQSL